MIFEGIDFIFIIPNNVGIDYKKAPLLYQFKIFEGILDNALPN